MSSFFDRFPRVAYDINGTKPTERILATNLLFRLAFIRETLGNFSFFYEYVLRDTDQPDTLAHQLYGNPEAHWVILLANNIVDPLYDWPMNSSVFKNYIIKKYGSVETAKVTVHHYEKIITREESLTGIITEQRFIVDNTKLTDNTLTVPHDYYTGLPATQSVITVNMGSGKTVVEIKSRASITNYDWEYDLNEKRRTIKLIKPEFYNQILQEFEILTGTSFMTWLRKPGLVS